MEQTPFRFGTWPAGKLTLNFCMNVVKNRLSSILAKPSPRHALLPVDYRENTSYGLQRQDGVKYR